MKNIGKPRYGVIDNGLFGLRIISGIVTGIRYTEDEPVYEISFGHDKWWTSSIYEKIEELTDYETLQLAPLERIIETHGLKIKYGTLNIIPLPNFEEIPTDCVYFDPAQGRNKCLHKSSTNHKCVGMCNYFKTIDE